MPESVEYNLYTRFHFRNQPGMAQMKTTSMAFASMSRNAKLARVGVRQVGTGLRQFSMFGMMAAGAIGYVVKKGVEFSKAWYDLKAVVQGSTENIEKLRGKAKQLGATTLYTATQSAKGMEELARAGLNARQVLGTIRPVLKLAVADNVDMALAAKLTAGAINQFKIKVEDASTITDTFAYVSRNTMTNTTELGEAFKYAGPAARLAGQDFHSMMGTLGLLAQINIKGSLAGTAYKNMVIKLAKGGKTANKIFGGRQGFLQAVTDSQGKWKPLNEIMKVTIDRLYKIPNEAVRAGLAFKLFGARGIAGMGAYAEATGEKFDAMITNIRTASVGTAESMAKIKQQSAWGQWMLLKSAIDGVAQSMFTLISPAMLSGFKALSGTLGPLAQAIQDINSGMSRGAVVQKYGNTIAEVAFGIKKGFTAAGESIKMVGGTIFKIFSEISGGSSVSIQGVTKTITKFVLLAAAIAPVVLVVGALSTAFMGMFNILSGGFKVLRALTSPWGIALMAITYTLAGGQKKGESFMSTMARGLKKLASLAKTMLWPFLQLQKTLGTIPALMAGIATYKMGKGLLARGGMALSASRNPLARMVGGGVGAATGMPVFVTNWPPGMGMGGAASMLPTAAGKAGMMASMAGGLKSLLAGGAGGLTGSAFIAAGGAFALAMAPAVAGLWAVAKAYDPKEQAKLRKKLMNEQRTKDKAKVKAEIASGVRRKSGELKGFQTIGMGGHDWTQKSLQASKWGGEQMLPFKGAFGQRLGRYTDASEKGEYLQDVIAPFLGQMADVTKAGRAKFAQQQLYDMGLTGWENMLTDPAAMANLKGAGVSQEQIDILKRIDALVEQQKAGNLKPTQIIVQIDGRNIAIATSQAQQESRERAGRVPGAGKRRMTLERGT